MNLSARRLIPTVIAWLFVFSVIPAVYGETVEKLREPQQHILKLDPHGHIRCVPIPTDEWLENYGIQIRTAQQRGPRSEVKFTTEFAQFEVTYIGFSDQAKAAFQKAVEIWAESVVSPVPIRIQANWEPLVGDTLGQAGSYFIHLLDDGFGGKAWYPDALADRIEGTDLAPGTPDIEATFNSTFNGWYFGLDQNPSFDKYDFVSVVLHEITHGLGFSTTFKENGGIGSWGKTSNFGGPFPKAYDLYLSDSDFFDFLIDKYPNNSSILGSVITGNDVFFDGPESALATNGRPVRIYAPTEYSQGSSISHLDEFLYPSDDQDSLMTPTIFNGEVQHDPGPIVRAIFRDMGWKTIEAMHFAQFAAGGGWSSDIVIQHPFPTDSHSTMRGSIEIYDTKGTAVDPSTVFPDLQSDGAFEIGPFGSKTFSSSSSGTAVFGTVTVKSDHQASGVIRFTFPGTGVAGVNASPAANKVMVPVRIAGELSSGVAIRNIQTEMFSLTLELRNNDGVLLTTTFDEIDGLAQVSKFISGSGGFFENYFAANPGDFSGSMVISTSTGSTIAAVGVEFESGAKITTLPVTPLP